MKLDKKDRERLYRSKGKPVKIEWPLEYAPRRGQRHAIHGDSGERVFSIRVEGVIWAERSAEVKIDDDPIRIMQGLGIEEPERVHASYEQILCREAEYRNRLQRAERTGSGKLAKEYAVRQAKRLEAA